MEEKEIKIIVDKMIHAYNYSCKIQYLIKHPKLVEELTQSLTEMLNLNLKDKMGDFEMILFIIEMTMENVFFEMPYTTKEGLEFMNLPMHENPMNKKTQKET